jgi:hypothetical protein
MSDTDEAGEELTEYVYTELEAPHSIRLLNLRPGGKKGGEVFCELLDKNLDDIDIEYEALSWSWGTDPWDEKIKILHNGEDFFSRVPRSLVAALKALRYRRAVRTLWIDAICINQQQPDEKNKQVPMMSRIYGGASSVCIWIGEADKDSKAALDFIKNEVLRLQDFDELCENQDASPKWRAMLNLMKRPWFSRRWVVQEIALASDAMIYCGKDTIEWKDFADAVQLFVEVETATHRLSEVMKKDPKFYHVPGWFEYVSALGASLLVDATGNLFRISKDKKREPLLSLEYLVSTLSVFEASEPRDTIYSLLAVAKDTSPIAVVHRPTQSSLTPAKAQLNAWAYRNMRAKPYKVDYRQPFIDICKEFILFSIRQSDTTRALDIICRPWAPPPGKKKLKQDERKKRKESNGINKNQETEKMPSWIPKLAGAAYAMYIHPNSEVKMGRQNADPLVGLPSLSRRNYSAAGTRTVNLKELKFKKREAYYSMYVSGFVFDKVAIVEVASQAGNVPEKWVRQGGWEDTDDDSPQEFWRTLVANRGHNGRNPPSYYARACKESITKGLTSGSLNTTELINDGRCSVVAEFFRRVQAVIWNRSLMRTESGNLAIARKDVRENDLICILYGCSVPVILRQHCKTVDDVAKEEKADEEELEQLKVGAAIRIQNGYRESVKRRARLRTLRLAKDQDVEGAKQREPKPVDTDRSFRLSQERQTSSEDAGQTTKDGEASKLMNGIDERKANSKLKRKREDDPGEPKPANKLDEPKSGEDPRNFYYEFIGECYVHGMMDGEAIKYQNDHEVRAQVFELR